MAYKSIKHELCNLKAEYLRSLEDTFQAAIYLIVSSWDKIPKADENIQLLVLSPCCKKKKNIKGKKPKFGIIRHVHICIHHTTGY